MKYGDSADHAEVVLPGNPYVVARNLAANREYDGPVVCTEPYFMNNRVTYQRLLAGDYEGLADLRRQALRQHLSRVRRLRAQGLVAPTPSPVTVAERPPRRLRPRAT